MSLRPVFPVNVALRVVALSALTTGTTQQVADSTFDVSVTRPAHRRVHPVVMIDEAHRNFHTAGGRYGPFAALLGNDGYRIVRGTSRVSPAALRGVTVYVTSNAQGPNGPGSLAAPAFTEKECDVIRDWVRTGGALLFVADHAPYGSATENLASRFGIRFGNGFVYDSTASLKGAPMNLVFSTRGGGLVDHPISRGRDTVERISRVIAFTGQSMTIPTGATALLRFSDNARESMTRDDAWARRGISVRGRAQGIALAFGRGRVVVLGEAAMLSAQIARWEEDGKQHQLAMGMNHPDTDSKQFTLNVMRWLSRVLN